MPSCISLIHFGPILLSNICMKLLLNIKKEKDDLGKLVNNLVNKLSVKTYIKHCIALLIVAISFNVTAQDSPYDTSRKYTLGGVSVSGNTTFNEQTIVAYSRLSKGQEINIPGDEVSTAIKRLWESNLFSDIDIYITKIEDNTAYLEIRLSDLPQLNDIKINGVKKGKV